ncbi:hypothetical protein OESDEN_17516 [Oesophagostomum dentatum]|uniref:Uncharacterized protein n=1 Tax=Oesophagostomum dentatum TaxID=61180 RepID=A0A0B1SCX8_OESDE|nr:hypothetical protein OESDEN_17516 [Oesophagostomum dentatum]
MEEDDTSTAVPLATSVPPCDRQSIIFFREYVCSFINSCACKGLST